ncbi:UNVERIFIED_CONTAM: ADP-ribosylation factor GTPase-activating protein AGD5, partial [Sesamum indicum]
YPIRFHAAGNPIRTSSEGGRGGEKDRSCGSPFLLLLLLPFLKQGFEVVTMNEKANVSKELNAKHRKVRSATLDTWLPEQVAFIQSADASSSTEKTVPANLEKNKTHSASGIEDLFKDSPSITPVSMSGKPQKDVKNDIMSLFEKSNIVSPFSVHQQQLAMLAQQQSLLMAAAAANASGGTQKAPGNAQLGLNGTNLPNQSWPNVGYQFPGMMTPAAGKIELEKYMQFESADVLIFFFFLLRDRWGTWEQLIQLEILILSLCLDCGWTKLDGFCIKI